MKQHIIVCPFNEKLISQMERRAVVVRLKKIDNIPVASHVVNLNNKLHCIIIESEKTLSDIKFSDHWKDIPIALYVSSMGSLKSLAGKIAIMKNFNLRVFLSSDKEENYRSLQILSSLGISCGIVFGKKAIKWELLNDLMSYAIYGKFHSADIEPFGFVKSHYKINKPTEFNSVYFDNPAKYLHLNERGNVALSHKELISGDYVVKRLDQLDSVPQSGKYKNRLRQWLDFFLNPKECAYCPGWRICLGKFSNYSEKKQECQKFFTDFIDAVDCFNLNKSQNKKVELWQP